MDACWIRFDLQVFSFGFKSRAVRSALPVFIRSPLVLIA